MHLPVALVLEVSEIRQYGTGDRIITARGELLMPTDLHYKWGVCYIMPHNAVQPCGEHQHVDGGVWCVGMCLCGVVCTPRGGSMPYPHLTPTRLHGWLQPLLYPHIGCNTG
jgi:hypothetical protein